MNIKPTAWLKELPPEDGNGMMMTTIEEVAKEWEEPFTSLYPKRTWVGLTDEDCLEALKAVDPETKRLPLGFSMFAANIEAKLKEKNNG